MKIIGIVGTRRRDSNVAYIKVKKAFFDIYEEGDWICSGGCKEGGDRFAEVIAKENGIPILIFYPKWARLKKGAGFVRNTDIAYRSDILVACVVRERVGGTEDTIMKFKDKLSGEKDPAKAIESKLILVEEV